MNFRVSKEWLSWFFGELTCAFIMEFSEKHLLTNLQKTCDHSEVMNQSQAFLGFLLRSRKIHLGGCFAFLGNYGILELFALNARIFGAELDCCDLRRVS